MVILARRSDSGASSSMAFSTVLTPEPKPLLRPLRLLTVVLSCRLMEGSWGEGYTGLGRFLGDIGDDIDTCKRKSPQEHEQLRYVMYCESNV